MQLGAALALALALLVPALITEAQQASNGSRVGVLYPGSATYWASQWAYGAYPSGTA